MCVRVRGWCVCVCAHVLTNEVLLLLVVLVEHLQQSDLNQGLVVEGFTILYDLNCHPFLVTMVIRFDHLWRGREGRWMVKGRDVSALPW